MIVSSNPKPLKVERLRLATVATIVPYFGGVITNKDNILQDNGSFTFVEILSSPPVGPSDHLMLTGFEFGVPLDATILGVEIYFRANGDVEPSWLTFQLVHGGAFLGAPYQINVEEGPLRIFRFGGRRFTWNAVITPAIVNDSTFGLWMYDIMISGQAAEIWAFDYLYMGVIYEVGACPRYAGRLMERPGGLSDKGI